ncbi:MAG: NAD(P)-binding protein [Methanoregulaceae archaeon]|nr:NAD(P)-binding protein [Methanoregulaceae archaeon]
MSKERRDLTLPPDLTQHRATGAVRSRRPIYLDLMPPCNAACPAGENIQGWLAKIVEGDDRGAWEILVQDNPMPAVHGRVCYHPCETSCNRGQLESPVSIHAVERYLGDLAIQEGWRFPALQAVSGKRVLVVGAGPAGLSCAYQLARRGHKAVILEAGPMAGGMMHFGIPAYRLPRNILEAEIARIQDIGVDIVFNHKVEDLNAEMTAGGFDAAFVAVGAHLGKKTDIPARDAGKVLDAVSFLKSVELGEQPRLGRRVAIYGGGNTAMDAARVARRLGVEPLIIYRRDRDHMPAHAFEADEAVEEGIKIHWLRTIKSVGEGTVEIEVMALDENGRPQPTGEIETLEADDLILALGQDTDTTFLRQMDDIAFQPDGVVVVDDTMMTGRPGVFAGGDMAPSERTVTVAVGHGKKAAKNIDAFLRNEAVEPKVSKDIATLEKLRLWFFADAAARTQNRIPLDERTGTFGEVTKGLETVDAQFEARRCFSCGNCFECDGCYGACPEDAIVKLGPGLGYKVNFDLCTGCGTCFDQCPVHAISLVPEPVGEATL